MKKNTYDAWSAAAVVVLVLSTIGAQHFSQLGYVFGCLAILTAVGSFALYVKALPKRIASDEGKSLVEVTPQQVATELVNERVAALNASRQQQGHRLSVPTQLHFFEVKRTEVKDTDERLLSQLDAYKSFYSARIKIHRGFDRDPALTIANIVERLCASAKEPRFEFILSKDGSFTIRPRVEKRSPRFDPEEGKEDSAQLMH